MVEVTNQPQALASHSDTMRTPSGDSVNLASNMISSGQDSVKNLIFKLLNDTFISLPARGCCSSVPSVRNSTSGKFTRSNEDLCFVHWDQAKVISGGLANLIIPPPPVASNSKHNNNNLDKLHQQELETTNSYLDLSNAYMEDNISSSSGSRSNNMNLDITHQMIDQSRETLVGDLFKHLRTATGRSLASELRDQESISARGVNYSDDNNEVQEDVFAADTGLQLAKLSYLSAGSLLALVGIITNLLILLIIFINVKQKCQNIASRGQTSHTNYHYVLLFQLTLTGLLLGGYILIDNINLYRNAGDLLAGQQPLKWNHKFHDERTKAAATTIFNQQARQHVQPARSGGGGGKSEICDELGACFDGDCENDNLEKTNYRNKLLASPLSIYLPPTPFEKVLPTFQDAAEPQDEALLLTNSSQHKPPNLITGFAILLNNSNQRNHDNISKQSPRNRSSRRRTQRMNNITPARLVRVTCELNTGTLSNGTTRPQHPESACKRPLTSNQSRIQGYFFYLLATVHLWTIVALAYDRYCAIAHPLEYLRAVNETRARVFLVILWSSSLLLNLIIPLSLDSQALPSNETNRTLRHVSQFLLEGHTLNNYFDNSVSSNNQYLCSVSTINAPTDLRFSDNDESMRFVQFLVGLSASNKVDNNIQASNRPQKLQYLSIALSTITFVLVILAPLIIITICNMSIYGIVKVHERRMSANSSSQSGGGIGSCYLGAFNSSTSTLSQSTKGTKRDFIFANNTTYLTANSFKAETGSLASSILGKLIKASAQVGAVGSLLMSSTTAVATTTSTTTNGSNSTTATTTMTLSKDDTSSQCSSSNEQEACQLISSNNNSGSYARIASSKAEAVQQSSSKAQMSSCYVEGNNCFRSMLVSNQDVAKHVEESRDKSSIVSRLTKRRKLISPRQQAAPGHSITCEMSPASGGGARDIILRRKLKRKLSDKEQAASAAPGQWRACSRKSSYAPSEQTVIMQEPSGCLGGDNCSCYSNQSRSQSRQQQQQHQQQALTDSDGIMRQLKMAGLSFAGIAIGELMASGQENARPLNRSSSCSLGNLASMNFSGGCLASNNGGRNPAQFYHFQSGQSVSRCGSNGTSNNHNQQQQHQQPSSEQQLLLQQREKRLSYVSLMSGGQPPQRDAWQQERYCTRLLYDSDSESHHGQFNGGQQNNPSRSSSQQQYFNLGGTKSVAFNIVVWLVLLMLSATLPQYLFTTLTQVIYIMSDQQPMSLGVRLRTNATLLNQLLNGDYSTPHQMDEEKLIFVSNEPTGFAASWIQTTSIWIDCLCRLLFLLMLPLNGWLYGIRSRSLRTTLKMVLKRYISKKQASIEINQRRKSVISTRSRESSVCCNSHTAQQQGLNFQHCKMPQAHVAPEESQQHRRQQEFANGRVFRRCASFNLPPHTRQEYFDSTNTGCSEPNKGNDDQVPVKTLALNLSAAAAEEEGGENEVALLGARRSHNSSIRFALSDTNHTHNQPNLDSSPLNEQQQQQQQHQIQSLASATSTVLAGCLLPIPALMSDRFSSSQTSSLDSFSLASSKRSLLSASIHSSHSAALLLLEHKNIATNSHAESTTNGGGGLKHASGSLPLGPTKLTSVLKKRNSSFMRRQESCDSASLNASKATSSMSAATSVQQNNNSGNLENLNSATGRNKGRSIHQSGHVVSFARTQSLDRDNSFDAVHADHDANGIIILDFSQEAPASSTASSASMAAPSATRARLRKSKAIITAAQPPLPHISSVETNEETPNRSIEDDQQNEATLTTAAKVSGIDSPGLGFVSGRRPSSDIKFLLTSAGDQAETKLLLQVEEQTCDGQMLESPDAFEPLQNSLGANEMLNGQMIRSNQCGELDEREFFDQIMLDHTRQQQNQRQISGNKLDYYKQIKEAISRYFYSSKRRRLEQSDACSCSSHHSSNDRSRPPLLRQHSDTAISIEKRANKVNQKPLSGDQTQKAAACTCALTARKLRLIHGIEASGSGSKAHSRRNSLDSQSQKLALIRQLEAQSQARRNSNLGTSNNLSPPLTAASTQATCAANMNRTSSSLSITSTGSAKSEQLHISQHRLQPTALQCHYQPQTAPNSHLKPPNSLKLIFDPDVQAAALYSSSLALSPIKECSSNHSCASSQSSLNNNNQQILHQQQQQSQQEPPDLKHDADNDSIQAP